MGSMIQVYKIYYIYALIHDTYMCIHIYIERVITVKKTTYLDEKYFGLTSLSIHFYYIHIYIYTYIIYIYCIYIKYINFMAPFHR